MFRGVPCVFRLFLVFRVCNLWEATSCRANTTYTETVSIPFARAPASSGASQTFRVELLSDVNEELRDHLVALVGTIGQGLAKFFPTPTSETCVLHNESFWNTFYLEVVSLLGVCLQEAYGPGDEAELCADLLQPLLNKAANCVSRMFVDEKADVARPAGEEGDEGHDTAAVYRSTLTLQARTEARKGQRGKKPCCDFSFEGWSGDRPLYFIPIEAKVMIEEKHRSQLAHYMATTVLVKYGKPKASIGVLIDKDSLCLAFSVTSVQVGQETIRLPVVLFSPQLKRRKGLAVQKPVVIALCLLCLYQETQMIQTPPVWKKAFGDDEWAKIVKLAEDLHEKSAQRSRARQRETVDMFQLVETLTMEVNELKE